MATAVLTNTPTIITTCESITGWSGDTFILDAGVFVQGSNSVSCAMTSTGANNIQFATSSAPGGQFAVTNIHIRFWFYLEFIGDISILANDGIQVEIVSGSGTALYTISGRDVYDGGFVQAVIYTGDTPTTGSIPSGTCTAVGLTVNTDTKPRNVPSNCYIDAMYFGDGYTVTGGTSGDEIDWSHIAALDLIERYGIVTNIDDIYFLAGEVTIGSAVTTWFKSGQKVQFRNTGGIASFDPGLFGIIFEGSGCRGEITGGAIGAAGTQDYLFDVSDSGIASYSMIGVQVAKANSVLFSAGQTISTSVFDNCGQVDPSTSTFTGNTFSNFADITTSGAMLFPPDDTNISNLNFVNCANGIEYDSGSDSTTPSFRSFTFDDVGGKYDVYNTSGSGVEIDIVDAGNANSYNPGGDTVTFNNFVYHNLTNLVNGSEVTYMKFGTAEDTGTTGETTAGSRNFDDSGKSWSTNQYQGRVLIIEAGADIGRYYVSSNSATQLKLDTALTATASTLAYSIQDENDMTEEYHVESVTGGTTAYGYNYGGDFLVDIMIQNVAYEEIVLLDILLSDTDQSLPQVQRIDVNYYNPT
jgi:hypothetical protein